MKNNKKIDENLIKKEKTKKKNLEPVLVTH